VLCCLVFGVAAPARADDAPDPKAIIQKAIAAHGGEANLSKYKAETMKAKGTVNANGMEIAYTGDFTFQPPGQLKYVMEAEAGGQKFTIAIVVNRDKGWMKIADMLMEMPKDRLHESQEALYGHWAGSLVPLVKHKGFTLAAVGEVKIDGKDAVGVRVSHKGHRDINFLFDKKTGLLLKAETQVKDDSGQEVHQEAFFSDYKESEGTKYPARMSMKRDGKDYLTMEVIERKAVESVDDSEFAQP
jgi:hypothetical protein